MKIDKHFFGIAIIYFIGMLATITLGEYYSSIRDFITMILVFWYVPQITRNEEKIKLLESEIERLNNNGKIK